MSIYITIAFRVITIMSFLLIVTLIISGRRTIGQLPVFDLLTIIVIGAITGADIAEPDIPHFHIIFAISVTYLFQKFMNTFYLKSKIFRELTTFPPMILIQEGKLCYENMKHVKYTIDEVLMLLRQSDIFDIAHVKYAILEPNGELSILRKDFAQFTIKGDLGPPKNASKLFYTVILDGKLDTKNISTLGIKEATIINIINSHGYSDPSEVFYAAVDKSLNITISPYDTPCEDI